MESTDNLDWRDRLRHVADVEVRDVLPGWLVEQTRQLLLSAASDVAQPNEFVLELANQISFRFEHQWDPELIDPLKILGNDYGPMGVALAAASLANHEALVERLTTGSRPALNDIQMIVQGAEEKVAMHKSLAHAVEMDHNQYTYAELITYAKQLRVHFVSFNGCIAVHHADWLRMCKAAGADMAVDPDRLREMILEMHDVLSALHGEVEGSLNDDETASDDWHSVRLAIREELAAGNRARATLKVLCRELGIDNTPESVQDYIRDHTSILRGVTRLQDMLRDVSTMLKGDEKLPKHTEGHVDDPF